MENTVQRIKQFIDFKGISVRKFEEKVGFSNGSFASQYKNNKTIGVDKLENILQNYPEINVVWLLTGEGEMLKPNVKEISHFENVKKSVNESVKNQMYKNIHTLQDIDISFTLQAKDEIISQLKERVAGLEQDKKALIQDKERAYQDRENALQELQELKHQYKLVAKEIEELKNVQDMGGTKTLVG